MHLTAHIQTDTPILVKNNEIPIPSESVYESQMSSVHTVQNLISFSVHVELYCIGD